SSAPSDLHSFPTRRSSDLSPQLNQTSSEPVMPLMLAEFLLAALITSVPVSLGLFCGVQPSSRLPRGPNVAPFGPHRVSLTTPVRSEEHTSELQSRGHLVCR